jgi:arsenate reductase (glutaredoxin)
VSRVTIYHNPACGTSRNVLGLIRNSGVEPTVVEYLKTPPSRDELVDLIGRMSIPVCDLLRRKGTPLTNLASMTRTGPTTRCLTRCWRIRS